jgi:hypothetical protein
MTDVCWIKESWLYSTCRFDNLHTLKAYITPIFTVFQINYFRGESELEPPHQRFISTGWIEIRFTTLHTEILSRILVCTTV